MFLHILTGLFPVQSSQYVSVAEQCRSNTLLNMLELAILTY